MGALTSRQNADVEETDVSANHAYRYPPKSGNYFGSHFIMGGERFDTPQPEAYLFGENADLNFLGSRPTVFPYPPPQTIEPTRTLKSLVNIRKESVRFTKIVDTTDSATKAAAATTTTTTPIIGGTTMADKLSGGTAPVAPMTAASYNIEFVYDADARCAITIYYFCTEEVTSSGCSYVSREPTLTSETFHCSSGVNQMFSQTSHSFRPHMFADDDLYYHTDRDLLPVVIHCVVEEGNDDPKQSHTTICVVDHHTDGTYVLRALKQKIFVDGLCYLLQEIYGIENKNIHKVAMTDDDTDDNGSECVICMCDTRDTLILPCRHLCLCNSCADSLRYQANNCPICRAPFRALLQIKAVRRKGAMAGIAGCGAATAAAGGSVSPPGGQQQQSAGEHIPSGYMAVSLIEALNGPPQMRMCEAKIDEHATQAAESLNRSKDTNDAGDNSTSRSSEIHMSVLSSPKDAATPTTTTPANATDAKPKTSPSTAPSKTAGRTAKHAAKQQQQQLRDTLKIINEKMSAAVAADSTADPDDDSDAEKLSPLLDKRQQQASRISEKIASQSTTDLSQSLDADECVQATTTGNDQPAESTDECATGESSALAGTATDDSDYYTPEEPQTTILSPLCPPENFDGDTIAATDAVPSSAVNNTSTECLTAAPVQMATSAPTVPAAIKEEHRSLPDSPVSGNSTISTRSSGDSYSSGSSTRQLLATASVQPPAQSQQSSGGNGCATDGNALLLKTTTVGVDGTMTASSGTSAANAVHV